MKRFFKIQTSKFKLQNSNFKAQILAAFTRSHLADSMFPRRTSPVARFMIGWWVPRVKILLVHLAKNPNSRADVAATWHSLLVTMSSLLVTNVITFGHYIRLLLYVTSPPPERTLSSGRPGCARGCFRRAGRPGPASIYYLKGPNNFLHPLPYGYPGNN